MFALVLAALGVLLGVFLFLLPSTLASTNLRPLLESVVAVVLVVVASCCECVFRVAFY